jgi:hypothetical protein
VIYHFIIFLQYCTYNSWDRDRAGHHLSERKPERVPNKGRKSYILTVMSNKVTTWIVDITVPQHRILRHRSLFLQMVFQSDLFVHLSRLLYTYTISVLGTLELQSHASREGTLSPPPILIVIISSGLWFLPEDTNHLILKCGFQNLCNFGNAEKMLSTDKEIWP